MNVSRQIDAFAQEGKWPLKSHRVMTFTKTPDLERLRKHQSLRYQHSISTLPPNRNGKRPKVMCSLCSNSTTFRQTSKECSSCRVPLGTQSIDGQKSCFTLWHEADDLKCEHERVHELLKASKAAKLPKRRKRNKRQRTESNKEANRRESDSSSDEDSGTYCVHDYFLEDETP